MDFVRSYFFPNEEVPQRDEKSVQLVRGSFGKKVTSYKIHTLDWNVNELENILENV